MGASRKPFQGRAHKRFHSNSISPWQIFLLLAVMISLRTLSGCSGLVSANPTNGGGGSPTSFSVAPTSLNFGSVAMGSKTSQTATVTNAGTKAITLSQTTITNNEFTISNLSLPAALPAGQSVSFLVWLNGSTAGSATGTMRLSSSDGTTSAPVGLSGTVMPGQPKLSVSTTSVNFGNVTVGSQGVQNVTLGNQGSADLTISLISVNATAIGASGITTPATIKVGQSATLTLTYSPNVSGTMSGSVTITSNDPQAPSSVISLSGTGTTTAVAPTITTQPANQTVTAGQTATFAVVAAGTAPLSYQWQKSGVNIAGATAASYATPATTTSDSGSTFRVVVSNTAGTVTSAAATLTVNAAPTPGIQVSSSSISFGSVVVGSNSSQVLIVTNTGTATLSITQLTETGAAFAVSGFSLPLNVSVGQQTTITVAFQPTAAGAASGSISIVSNAPNSPTSVSLSGTGATATYLLGISPTSLSFGNVNTGSSASQNITITNTGNSTVNITQFAATGTGFSMPNSPVSLSPSQNTIVAVQFAPTTAGSVTGTITITSNATGSPATVTLSGTGVTPVQHSVALTWQASTSTVAGYNVYRSTVSGQSYTKVNGSLVSGLSYTDSTVQSGITYYYVTTAVDSSNSESVYSNEVPASIP